MKPELEAKVRALAYKVRDNEPVDVDAEIRALRLKVEEERAQEAEAEAARVRAEVVSERAWLPVVAVGGLVRLAAFGFLFLKVESLSQTIILTGVTFVFVDTMLERSKRVFDEMRRFEISELESRLLLRYVHEIWSSSRDSPSAFPLDAFKEARAEREKNGRLLRIFVLIRDVEMGILWLVAAISVFRAAL